MIRISGWFLHFRETLWGPSSNGELILSRDCINFWWTPENNCKLNWNLWKFNHNFRAQASRSFEGGWFIYISINPLTPAAVGSQPALKIYKQCRKKNLLQNFFIPSKKIVLLGLFGVNGGNAQQGFNGPFLTSELAFWVLIPDILLYLTIVIFNRGIFRVNWKPKRLLLGK